MDINCQITTKCTTIPKPKLFHELNTAKHDYNGEEDASSVRMPMGGQNTRNSKPVPEKPESEPEKPESEKLER